MNTQTQIGSVTIAEPGDFCTQVGQGDIKQRMGFVSSSLPSTLPGI